MDSELTNAPQDTAQQVDWAARLFEEHQAFIRSTLQFFIKNTQEEEEIYQDLFVYFVRKPIPDEVLRVKAWLYRVILDRIRDRKRRQSRYHKRLQAYALERPDRSDIAEAVPPDREQIAEVFELIKHHLTERQARAVLYKYQQQLDVEEIARRMEVDPRTVSRYVSVGLKKLRLLLNKDEKE